ncbi:MAG: hypothetical protein Q8905_06585 [Bacteroidota bacterium]|nr:hypothetical protein [Bacteroidota bacterium]
MALYLLLLLNFLFPQTAKNYEYLYTLPEKGTVCTSDGLGNIYLVSGRSIIKYSENSRKNVYTNAYLGHIQLVDVSNPFRIVVFYKDFNQLVFLDNFLSPQRSPVSLDDLGYSQVELVCGSGSEGFWLFDNIKNCLVRIGNNLQPLYQSADLNLFTASKNRPVYMTERNSRIYLSVPGTGILIFDHCGNHLRTVPLNDINSFQVQDGRIIYLKNHCLNVYNIEMLKEMEITLPDTTGVTDARLEGEKLILLKAGKICVYKKL